MNRKVNFCDDPSCNRSDPSGTYCMYPKVCVRYVWKIKVPDGKKFKLVDPKIHWLGNWVILKEEWHTPKAALKFKNSYWRADVWIMCEVTTEPLMAYYETPTLS